MPSAKSADGKARQRARNKAAGGGSRAGSSGVHERLRDAPSTAWDEAVASGATHLCDLLLKVSSYQRLQNNGIQINAAAPPDSRDQVEAMHQVSQFGYLMVRVLSLEEAGAVDADEA